jgi:hypothetical protein
MGLVLVPVEAGSDHGLTQYRLTDCETAQCHSVETRERVKGVSLDVCPFNDCIEELKVEKCIVTDQYCPIAFLRLDFFSDILEDASDCVRFFQRWTQGMERIDSGYFERSRIQSRSREWFDVIADCFAGTHVAIVI